VHPGFEHHPERIHQQMPLSSAQFLRSIVSAYTTDAGSLHRLGVEDAGARLGVAPCACACLFAQHRVDLLPGAVQAPHPEVMVHRRPWRELARKHAPLAAASQEVEDGVEELLRVGHLRGRPPGLAGGMSGAKISHSRSERSLGYGQRDEGIGVLHEPSVLLIEPHYLPSRTASRGPHRDARRSRDGQRGAKWYRGAEVHRRQRRHSRAGRGGADGSVGRELCTPASCNVERCLQKCVEKTRSRKQN